MALTVEPYGDEAVYVPLPDAAAVHELFAAAGGAPAGVDDVVPGPSSLVVRYRPATIALHEVAGWLRSLDPVPLTSGRTRVIEVSYDGADLEGVARTTGLSVDEVIARHTGASYRVVCLGFTPGFAYLDGGDPALALPRRSEPRTSVPAGSVAIAGALTGLYPLSSPGGWHLLGRTAAVLFDAMRMPPALLAPGDRVRFVAAP